MLVSRYSFTDTPLSVLIPARSARSISGLTPIPITTRSASIAWPSLSVTLRSSIATTALLQMEHHAVAFVQTAQVFAHLWSENRGHRHRLRRDDVDLELSLNQRSRNLHRNEARAYQHDALGLAGLANNRAAITLRAQIANMRRVRAGNLELHGLGAGREEQRIKFALAAIGKLDALVPRIDRRDPRIQQQFDLVLAVEVHASAVESISRSRCRQESPSTDLAGHTERYHPR